MFSASIKIYTILILAFYTQIGLDYLIGSLLSSEWKRDLQKLNPYFNEETILQVYDVIATTIMHANRIGQTNRSLSDARDVLGLLKVAQAQSAEKAAAGNAPLLAGLLQKVKPPL